MWCEVLGEKQMMEYRFLRQRPIGNYIMDFFCKELMLIIEVDGYTHQCEEVAVKDQAREKELKEMGYSILRFEDSEVLHDMNNVVRSIENWILDRGVTPNPFMRGRSNAQKVDSLKSQFRHR